VEGKFTLNLLTLHRAPDRRSYFAAEAQPILFDETLRCWVVADRRLAESLLQHENLATVDYVDAYERLQKQFAIPYSNLLYAFRHIPICLNDEAHHRSRRRVAEVSAANRSAFAAAIPRLVSRWFGLLDAAERVELMGQVLLPLVDEVMATLVGIDASTLCRFRGVPGIFDRMIGLRRRSELEAEVGAARAAIGIENDIGGARLTLLALGHDALLGTIGESLHYLVAANADRRLSDIVYPGAPVETGVPYVERVARQAFAIDSHRFDRGDRIRILMQSFAYAEAQQERLRMFGVGPHACIGRQLSLDLWSQITAKLAQVTRRATIIRHALRSDDYVWTCPSELLIELHDDDV
jgi:cytochrome P450